MPLFILATLLPATLLICGSVFGGLWVVAAVLAITVFDWGIDRFAHTAPNPREEFPSGDGLAVLLAVLHLPLLLLAVWTIGGTMHSILERLGLLVGYGLFFGQIGHPNAHELIHRGNRWLRRLGKLVYSSLLIGHHVSAHPLVHHIHVGTDKDPSSARKGQGFWRFAGHCWRGGFRAGLAAENKRRRGQNPLRHPYLHYLAIAALTIGTAASFGVNMLFALLAICFYAQLQMMLSDYVQHYGLRRKIDERGKAEPVSAEHSWNTPHRYSSAMMLNAPRHSDHHLNPGRAYPGLRLTEDMPRLPYSLPVMAVIALYPALWRRIMDPRLAAWLDR